MRSLRSTRVPAGGALVLVVALLVSCGSGVGDRGHDEAVTWSEEATADVVSVDSGGGLPPPESVPERFEAVPDFVLYGDGTAYWQDEDGFRTARLDRDGVATVLDWAGEAGLLDPDGVDTGEPEVYDVGATRYDLNTGSGTQQTVVYAPGFEGEDVGLSADEIRARDRIESFRQRLFDLDGALPEDRFLRPEAPLKGQSWEVLTRPTSAADDVLSGTEPVWRIDDPAVVGRCRVVSGVAADRVAREVGSTGTAQIWAVDGDPWVVVARPLLPGGAAPCAGGG